MQEETFESLVGKTMVRFERGERDGNDAIIMTDTRGIVYVLTHSQDCCESVVIEDITGDLADLIDSPLTLAEEVTKDGKEALEAGLTFAKDAESSTWTFYKFATIKGYVDIRFYGDSNGYYSEGVSFRRE
jgi:hypothetical protein